MKDIHLVTQWKTTALAGTDKQCLGHTFTEALEGHFDLLLITYYLLLTTYYLLFITYYLLLITYYLPYHLSPL